MPEICSEDSRIATVLEIVDRGVVIRDVTSRVIGLIVLSINSSGIVAAPVLSMAQVLFQAPAQAQSKEAVGKVAKAITVRIEGATQGSGVLVKRDGNRYTVLTAWHVVSGQRPGEELDIYTSDGQGHQLERGSIKRLGEVDMAVLTFSSPTAYEVARVGDVNSVRSGDQIVVTGFPIGSNGQTMLNYGELVANAAVGIDQGYQLLYRNETTAGMSGGAVLTTRGILVGIHGRGELDELKSQQSGMLLKTGTNQGVPIGYYKQFAAGVTVAAYSTKATSIDDFLAQAKILLYKKGLEQDVISLANQVLATNPSEEAYLYRARAKRSIGDYQGAIDDCNKVISFYNQNREMDKPGLYFGLLHPLVRAYNERSHSKSALGDREGARDDAIKGRTLDYIFYITSQVAKDPSAFHYTTRGQSKSYIDNNEGAIADFNQAIAINPQHGSAYIGRGNVKSALGDKQGAIADYNQAIALNPQYAAAYNNRGNAKYDLGDKQGAIADYDQAIVLKLANPYESSVNLATVYYYRGNAKFDLSDMQGAIADYNQAIVIDLQYVNAFAKRGIAFNVAGDIGRACKDWRKAASLGDSDSANWVRKQCQ